MHREAGGRERWVQGEEAPARSHTAKLKLLPKVDRDVPVNAARRGAILHMDARNENVLAAGD